jgi:hypothetical protein
LADNGIYYFPEYINRFTKMGPLINMWFKPLQNLFGDIVNYDNNEDESKSIVNENINVVD